MPWLLKELDEDKMDTFLSGLLGYLHSPSADTKAVVEGLIKDGLLERIREHIATCVTSAELSQEESMSRASTCIKSLRLISETAANVRRPSFGSDDIQAIMERLDPLCHNPSTTIRALCIRGLVIQEFPISAAPVQAEPEDEEENDPDLDEDEEHRYLDEDEEDPDSDEDSDEERTRALVIAAIEFERGVRNNIGDVLKYPKDESSIKSTSVSTRATTSKAVKEETKIRPKRGATIRKIPVLSYEQKVDLSDAIQALDEQKLGRVIQIIREGVPEIQNSQEEIELKIDTLPTSVLANLYNFVFPRAP